MSLGVTAIFRVYDVPMSTGPKNAWGGKRDGSGRKRAAFSDAQVVALIRAAKKKEKDTGVSVADQLMRMIYGRRTAVSNKEKLTAIKLFYDQVVTVASETESHVTTSTEPAIYLPEQMPDPAKLVAVAGGKK